MPQCSLFQTTAASVRSFVYLPIASLASRASAQSVTDCITPTLTGPTTAAQPSRPNPPWRPRGRTATSEDPKDDNFICNVWSEAAALSVGLTEIMTAIIKLTRFVSILSQNFFLVNRSDKLSVGRKNEKNQIDNSAVSYLDAADGLWNGLREGCFWTLYVSLLCILSSLIWHWWQQSELNELDRELYEQLFPSGYQLFEIVATKGRFGSIKSPSLYVFASPW